MRAQQHELDLLHREGYEYRLTPPRGWYFKGKWIGHNVKDAFDHWHASNIIFGVVFLLCLILFKIIINKDAFDHRAKREGGT